MTSSINSISKVIRIEPLIVLINLALAQINLRDLDKKEGKESKLAKEKDRTRCSESNRNKFKARDKSRRRCSKRSRIISTTPPATRNRH